MQRDVAGGVPRRRYSWSLRDKRRYIGREPLTLVGLSAVGYWVVAIAAANAERVPALGEKKPCVSTTDACRTPFESPLPIRV